VSLCSLYQGLKMEVFSGFGTGCPEEAEGQGGGRMGYIDMHSHILPGMDDGSRSMSQTLRMLEIAVSEGITASDAPQHAWQGMPARKRGTQEGQ
jgi:hypothetical protein